MKRCVTCHMDKPFQAFNRHAREQDGHQPRCRECSKDWYRKHRGDHIVNVRARSDRVRAEDRRQLHNYLAEHPCVDCGEDDIRSLEFDHRPGVKKKAGVGWMLAQGVRWAQVREEIAKCDIRCVNCHRKRTSERGRYWKQAIAERQLAEAQAAASQRLRNLFPTAVG